MPTVLREGPYRFSFFSLDMSEPPHIHVRRDRSSAKFWLQPVSLAYSHGLADHELNDIKRRVEQHQVLFLEAWDEYFNT